MELIVGGLGEVRKADIGKIQKAGVAGRLRDNTVLERYCML